MRRISKRTWIVLVVAIGVLFCICIISGVLLPKPKPDQNIIDAMAIVCEGKGVPGAAAYSPGSSSQKVVLLDESGRRHPWTDLLPYEWWPKTIEETQLVACLGEEHEQFVDTCEYSGGQIVERYLYSMPIRVVAASTGETVVTGTVRGESPRACQLLELADTKEIYGAHVTHQDLEQWLRDQLP